MKFGISKQKLIQHEQLILQPILQHNKHKDQLLNEKKKLSNLKYKIFFYSFLIQKSENQCKNNFLISSFLV